MRNEQSDAIRGDLAKRQPNRWIELPVRRSKPITLGPLTTDDCPEVLTEVFLAGTTPTEVCSLHGEWHLEWQYTDIPLLDVELWLIRYWRSQGLRISSVKVLLSKLLAPRSSQLDSMTEPFRLEKH